MYGVDQVELVKRNPEIAVGVKEGMVVIVPVNKVSGVSENQTRPAAADGSTLHEVAQGETLFSLGQRYGVEAEARRFPHDVGRSSDCTCGMPERRICDCTSSGRIRATTRPTGRPNCAARSPDE